MALITGNENNPATLKIILANNFSKAKCAVNLKPNESKNYLPFLSVNANLDLFIPNAAIWYLLPPEPTYSDATSEFLEFESLTLTPTLIHGLCGNTKHDKTKNNISFILEKLDVKLQEKLFFIGESVTVADIAVFSTLYPLYKSKKLNEEYLKNCANILKWVENFEKLPEVKDGISVIFGEKVNVGETSYQILMQSAKYTNAQFEQIKPAQANTVDKDSPTTEVTQAELEAAQNAWSKSVLELPKLKKIEKVVLPKSGEKNIFITSALPYVNNVPHLGNIIGCVLSADVYARYSRLCNNNTLFICGTDEYGTATETKALEEGLSCQAICDKYFKIHSDIYNWFNISFDHFGRTSNPEQTELAQDLFLQLNDNGFMFTQSVEQLHCEKCDRYLADRFVEGGCPNIGCNYEDARGDQCDGCGKLVNAIELKNPRCKICGKTPKLKTSSQFFIDLPKLEPLLRHWIKISSPGWSHNADVIAKAWLKEGLKPRCITRDLKWGVPVPLEAYKNKVFYVWFDAPIGYISISKAYTKEFEQWWRPKPDTKVTLYQFMAKDNVPFHAVLFPSMLLGANKGYTTVSHIMATEYLNYEDGKFSKSRGVGVFGNDARETGIPSDVWRFYLLYVRPESQDSSFSWSDLVTKNNSELLNNLGNFVNRALVFAKNSFNKIIPKMALENDDYQLLALCTRELKGYTAALEQAKLKDGIRHILSISRHGNQYMQQNQPWVKLKGDEKDKLRAGTVIGVSCNIACLLATLLQPYMPDTSSNLKKQLNCEDFVLNAENPVIVNLLPAGHQLGEPSPLFTKIEPTQADDLKKRFAGTQEDRNNKNSSNNQDIAVLEAQVAQQGDKVRSLKSSGVDKAIWQPEVKILLELKGKLEAAKKVKPTPQSEQKPVVNGLTLSAEEIKKLEESVAQQGLVVRKLKEGGAEKSVWQPEVDKLLTLKNKLAVATGSAAQAPKGKKGKK
ncbi:hypothetical protein GWI33_005442 [Rhynchophorus ferrugineus]|uniref:Methionine--tRNA ligase, cytoplasmic n=1 Tax=Rhynchophorus ferrugineus TaxID=354439 RepID=A0A834MDS6_RHYFE|nr:hypothetical protein GWI33_005442 [Rhynchophorus ferrugineus]